MYSFGVVLWEMLAGRQPWASLQSMAVAYSITILKERLPLDAPAMPAGRCPARLRALLLQCWDADPQRRPSADEALKELMVVQQCGGGGEGGGGTAAAAEVCAAEGRGPSHASSAEPPPPPPPRNSSSL